MRRSLDQIKLMAQEWEATPAHMNTVKLSFIDKKDLEVKDKPYVSIFRINPTDQ